MVESAPGQLQRVLEETIAAMASMVEMKDPYTSGHQRRVAGLASAIAKEMGLDDSRLIAVRLAGAIHDLGKLAVPSEILNKPGTLTSLERKLIRIHPQAAYDILKGIDFPWPVAQIVLQHHERLDGSGYPQGLRGDDILLESRIVTVADWVEATASHRPYRPAHGLQSTLTNLATRRGSSFDPAVVDTCLALFHEGRIAL